MKDTTRTFPPTFRQIQHAIGLLVLSGLLYLYLALIGGDGIWAMVALATATLHQGTTAVIWRSEIHGQHMSRVFGRQALLAHGAQFFTFFFLRIGSTVLASVSSPHTLTRIPTLMMVLSAATVILVGWTFFSVFKYFGIKRALGADHFSEDYRRMDFVREAIFRYTPNAMYTFGTLMFVIPGLLLRSNIGIASGVFHYVAVWLHYWATEVPDMILIYGHLPENSEPPPGE